MPEACPAPVAMTASVALAGTLARSHRRHRTRHPPLDYVALGDSSAGLGVPPVDLTNLLCLRSTANYPHVIASATGARLKDVTCGAAQTSHFTQAQYPGVAPPGGRTQHRHGPGHAGPSAATTTTRSSTPSRRGLRRGPQRREGQPLQGQTWHVRRGPDREQHPTPRSRAALRTVRDKAPNARVAALGYPWITPATADPSCFVKLPVAAGDVPYLRDIQTRLNAVVERAAEETGATYVDFSRVSEGHDACEAPGTRWIEPLLFGHSLVPRAPQRPRGAAHGRAHHERAGPRADPHSPRYAGSVPSSRLRRVAVLVLGGCQASRCGIPAQVFTTRASMPYEVRVCGAAPGLVTGGDGLSYHAAHGLDALAWADVVFLPGYRSPDLDDPPRPSSTR